jgi:hypothetical protein
MVSFYTSRSHLVHPPLEKFVVLVAGTLVLLVWLFLPRSLPYAN